jgi:hypothetical protein
MCEGFTLEDALLLHAAVIAEYGFVVIGVGPPDAHAADAVRAPDDGACWAYTVGLLDAACHPELIMAGPVFEASGPFLSRLGTEVLGGRVLRAGERFASETGEARVGSVDPIQYRLDTFNVWHNLRTLGYLRHGELEALQVFAPADWFCSKHQESQPVLADPDARVDRAPGPNRSR